MSSNHQTNRILIAVDFSTESREALDYMLKFAQSPRDELVLLSVVETYGGVFNMLKGKLLLFRFMHRYRFWHFFFFF